MFIKKYFKNLWKVLGEESLLGIKIEEICCNEKFSTEEVNLFCLWKIATTFKAKLVMFVKNLIECVY